MKLLTALSILLLSISFTTAQEIAVSERGDTVVLYSNGTWDYFDNYTGGTEKVIQIKMNNSEFTKSKKLTKKVEGSRKTYEVWYDHKIWKRIPVGELNPDADIAFKLINGDTYAMVIFEELEIPLQNLSSIALDNAVGVVPDIKMIDREYRVVNDNKLVWMRMDGTTQGMKISYSSYFYSNEKGSLQFHVFTGQNLVTKYKNEIEELLNGLIIL